mgnify:CR=1 FL=1
MKSLILREKDKAILNLIVESYLRIGKPISSGFIAQKKESLDSAATIRNIMAKLEDFGFLIQPHTSAGRIPTDKGLKFYVNSLSEKTLLLKEKASFLPEDFSMKKGDLNSLLVQVSRLLAEYSDNLGFVISPRISKINFHHLHFIKVAEDKIMIVLITSFNLYLTEIVQSNDSFSQAELDEASQYINQSFRGKNLTFIRDYLFQELPKYHLKYETLINKLTSLLKTSIVQEEGENQIFLEGTSKLVGKVELFDMEKLKSLFQKLEEKAKLAKLLSDFIALDQVKVLIGSELNLPDISDCALILSHYGYENQVLGSLGIIGPKRIPYGRIIPLVNCVARRLSRTISYFQ